MVQLSITMTTDASVTGWGCCLNIVSTGGNWTSDEVDINYLDICEVLLALKLFAHKFQENMLKSCLTILQQWLA